MFENKYDEKSVENDYQPLLKPLRKRNIAHTSILRDEASILVEVKQCLLMHYNSQIYVIWKLFQHCSSVNKCLFIKMITRNINLSFNIIL